MDIIGAYQRDHCSSVWGCIFTCVFHESVCGPVLLTTFKSDLNINKVKSRIYKRHQDFLATAKPPWQKQTSRRSHGAVWVGKEHLRSAKPVHAMPTGKERTHLVLGRPRLLSADVIQEGDDGIIANHSLKKSVQSIVAVTKASIIRKDVKNKIESTGLRGLAHAHTGTKGDTRIHLLPKHWVEFHSFDLKKCHNETGKYPNKVTQKY